MEWGFSFRPIGQKGVGEMPQREA
jgi:hypothetical protein